MANLQFWVTLIPLLTIAGSAAAYVIKFYQESSQRRRAQFFELMQFFDSDKPIATKCAAAYELRNFPEHEAFIVRFCENIAPNITGGGAAQLRAELEITRRFFTGEGKEGSSR